MEPLPAEVLPDGVGARFAPNINGLTMHLLEAGDPQAPLLLLLHGFPELAYSWRKVMPALAQAGFHVVAPDQRGYGRTTGWDADYDGDLAQFRMLNLARDALGLVYALGRREVHAVIGHDFGSPVAAWCALTRPDVFRRVVLMSAPFGGPPAIPFGAAGPAAGPRRDIHADLAALDPPRLHYQWYYSERRANAELMGSPQGVHAFLRAYYHHKSADFAANRPYPLAGWTAAELARLPTYYVMEKARTMPETVAEVMPTAAEIAACRWLQEAEMAVYAAEYQRTGFQGGLSWYRAATSGILRSEMELFAGRTIDIPSAFIAGASDWGVHQTPGVFEAMQSRVLSDMRGCWLIDGAGHWVQQEQPAETSRRILEFLGGS